MRYIGESLWVAFGASIGAVARFWISNLCRASHEGFPWPTLLINVGGSFLLGAFVAASLERAWGEDSKQFFAVGICGGFTTFSTFSFEVIDLFYRRSWKAAALYALLSLVLAVGGCFAGVHAGRIAFAHHTPQSVDPSPDSD